MTARTWYFGHVLGVLSLGTLSLGQLGCYAGGAGEATGEETGAASSSSSGGEAGSSSSGAAWEPVDPEVLPTLSELGYTHEQAREYLAEIAPMVVGRLLSESEDNLIRHFGADAVAPIVEDWIREPAFADTARLMLQVKLQASGSKDGVDFELPGNLAAHIARNDLPYAHILTANYCVDPAGAAIPCDTGAPYAAGVLTTRAYLIANASRFNLRRARRMMFIFSCRVYPMDTLLQPPVTKSDLIPMFQAETADEQTVPEAANGFGNGLACYSCHSQFSAHAQLFVRFDETGLWRADATGLQDPMNELGRSTGGLFASHFQSPVAAPKEVSQVYGRPVKTLSEAARVIAEEPKFYDCAARNVLEYTFGMSESDAQSIEPALLGELADLARARDFRLRPDNREGPSLGDVFAVALTHHRIVRTVIGAPAGEPQDPAAE